MLPRHNADINTINYHNVHSNNQISKNKKEKAYSHTLARNNLLMLQRLKASRNGHPILPRHQDARRYSRLQFHSNKSGKSSHPTGMTIRPKLFSFPTTINNHKSRKYNTVEEPNTRSNLTSLNDRPKRRTRKINLKLAGLIASNKPKSNKSITNEARSKQTSLNDRHKREAGEIKITSLNDDHPWLVEMHIPIQNAWIHRNCTGTLVSRKMVVASAHCFDGVTKLEDPEIDIVTVVMEDDLADIKHKFPKQIFIGEEYVQDAPDIVGDIALVEIYGNFGEWLDAVALPGDNVARNVNHLSDNKLVSCRVSALDAHDYGTIHELNVMPVLKKECEVGYMDLIKGHEEISDTELLRRASKYTKDKVCVTASSSNCDQYFQGPLICNDHNSDVSVVYGVFSSQLGKCGAHPFVHLVFTAVQEHIHWINNHLGNIPSLSSSILKKETSKSSAQLEDVEFEIDQATETESPFMSDVAPTKTTRQITASTNALTNEVASDDYEAREEVADGIINHEGSTTEMYIADSEHGVLHLETLPVSIDNISTEKPAQENEEDGKLGFENMENLTPSNGNYENKEHYETRFTESANSEEKKEELTEEQNVGVTADVENKTRVGSQSEIIGDFLLNITKDTMIHDLETVFSEDKPHNENRTGSSLENEALHIPNNSKDTLNENRNERIANLNTLVNEGKHSNNQKSKETTDDNHVPRRNESNEIKEEIEKIEAKQHDHRLDHFQNTLNDIKDKVQKGDALVRDEVELITSFQAIINEMKVEIRHVEGKQQDDDDQINNLQVTLNKIRDAIATVEKENQDEEDVMNDMQETLSELKEEKGNADQVQQREVDLIRDMQNTVEKMKDEIRKDNFKLEEENDLNDNIRNGAGSKNDKGELTLTSAQKVKDKGTNDRSRLNLGRVTGGDNKTKMDDSIHNMMPGFDKNNEGDEQYEENYEGEDQFVETFEEQLGVYGSNVELSSGNVRCAGVVIIVMCIFGQFVI